MSVSVLANLSLIFLSLKCCFISPLIQRVVFRLTYKGCVKDWLGTYEALEPVGIDRVFRDEFRIHARTSLRFRGELCWLSASG